MIFLFKRKQLWALRTSNFCRHSEIPTQPGTQIHDQHRSQNAWSAWGKWHTKMILKKPIAEDQKKNRKMVLDLLEFLFSINFRGVLGFNVGKPSLWEKKQRNVLQTRRFSTKKHITKDLSNPGPRSITRKREINHSPTLLTAPILPPHHPKHDAKA